MSYKIFQNTQITMIASGNNIIQSSGDICGNISMSRSGGLTESRVIVPSLAIKQEARPVAQVKYVSLSSFGTLHVTLGSGPSLFIEGNENLLPYVATTIKDARLVCGLRDVCLKGKPILAYHLTLPSLEGIEISGQGIGRILGVAVCFFEADVSGQADLTIEGTAGIFEANVSGQGKVTAQGLSAGKVKLRASGQGEITVCATDTCYARASGAARIKVFGNPVSKDIGRSGLGDIEFL